MSIKRYKWPKGTKLMLIDNSRYSFLNNKIFLEVDPPEDIGEWKQDVLWFQVDGKDPVHTSNNYYNNIIPYNEAAIILFRKK